MKNTEEYKEKLAALEKKVTEIEKKHKDKINELVSENNKKVSRGNPDYNQMSSLS